MSRRAAPAALLLALAACGPPPAEHERPVVRINGDTLSRAQLETYLGSNLAGAEVVEDDLVRSRLLDAWIDEHLILVEATERMLTIPEESIEALLNDPDYESGEGEREDSREVKHVNLRNRLMIEMLQGQVLQDIVLPTVEEAGAWLERQPPPPGSGRSVELRSLRFDDPDLAQSVHRSLRRNRLTYSEAVLQNTEDESQGIPTVVDLDTLPPEVHEAIETLKPGWSSKPVDVGGSTYLFQVRRWIETDQEARIDAARDEIFATARRAAWELFVAQLRERARIRIFQENLPFTHVSP